MKRLWVMALIAACDVGGGGKKGDEHVDAPIPEITGTITADTTWTGQQRFEGITVIAPNVTVTVEAGAELLFGQNAGITVEKNAALVMFGMPASKVIAKPDAGATDWGPISVLGRIELHYADFTGGGITTNDTFAKLEIADSRLYKTAHDYIIMNGGSINMMYSHLGPYDGETDTTHCHFHINAATTVSVIRSNIASAPFGFMFYGGVGVNFQFNNWYGNQIDVDTMAGVDGNFSFGWFEKGPPTAVSGAMITAENLATERIMQAGPRP